MTGPADAKLTGEAVDKKVGFKTNRLRAAIAARTNMPRGYLLAGTVVLCVAIAISGCTSLDATGHRADGIAPRQPDTGEAITRQYKKALQEITGSRSEKTAVQALLVGMWLSPSKKSCLLAIRDVFAEKEAGRVYNLFLMDAEANMRYVHTYQRGIEVAWSPSGSMFFINDHHASDASNCLLFDGYKGILLLDVEERLRKMQSKEFQDIPSQNSCHIAGTSWLQDDALLLEITGWSLPESETTAKPYAYEGSYGLRKDELLLRKLAPE